MPEKSKSAPASLAQYLGERAALRSITETFRIVGIDITDMDDLNDLRDDFRFVRRQRMAEEARRSEFTKSLISALVGGAITMLVSGLTWLVTTGRH